VTKKLFLIFFEIIFYQQVFAQSSIDTNAIRNELEAIFDRDQKTRTAGDSSAFMHYMDSCNQVKVTA